MPVVRRIVALGGIPLIQGTLRYAYKLEYGSGSPKERGEGAVFAAAIVPRLYNCNTNDAAIVMNNMKVGAVSTSFSSVKAAFEANYACMGITCAEVGGIWSTAQSTYYNNAAPCADTSASLANIAGYAPGTKVTSHNAIDLDQQAIELELGQATIDYNAARNIYQQGGMLFILFFLKEPSVTYVPLTLRIGHALEN